MAHDLPPSHLPLSFKTWLTSSNEPQAEPKDAVHSQRFDTQYFTKLQCLSTWNKMGMAQNYLPKNAGWNTEKKWKAYFLRVIPTNWYSIWQIFWLYIWHSIWYVFRHSMWHSFWHISIIIYIIYILTFHLTFYLAFYLTYILTFYLAFHLTSCAHGWGPAVPIDIWRWRLRSRKWDLELAVEAEAGRPALIKSRDPHLAGGKQILLVHKVVPPKVISWFIIPLTIDISTISPSY